MDPEAWKKIDGLFSEALDLPPDERIAWVTKECAGDTDLLEAVMRLIRAEDTSDDFLDVPVGSLPEWLENEPGAGLDDSLPTIGPYKLLKALGHGGMGSVYLAHREDVDKKVAVKIVRQDVLDPMYRDRFLQERRVLARLQHPNIAQFLDAGITDAGTPYFALEYVDGIDIVAYCDQNKLTIQERLNLFVTVCDAVEFAHRNLIVHRDLKPSNILVSSTGVVKLLDFGIAKMIEDQNPDIDLTLTDFRIVTPAYASPEQVTGDPITTSSDVYMLGVLMYELLSGHRPFALRGKRMDEMVRIITDGNPEPPSSASNRTEKIVRPDGSEDTVTLASVALARGENPSRIPKVLSGDLDNIALKAIRKEPDRRYPSVQLFAEDVRRYLSGLPVSARKDVWTYRASKFVSRNRLRLASAASILGILVATTGIYTWRLNEARKDAQKEADTASRMVGLVESLFQMDQAGTVNTDSLVISDFVDLGEERVMSELADDPEMRANMLGVLGRVQQGLGDFTQAVRLYEQAIEDQRKTPDDLLIRLQLELAGLLYSNSQYREAERYYREALAVSTSLHGAEHPITLDVLDQLIGPVALSGRLDEAEVMAEDLLAKWGGQLGDARRATMITTERLAYIYRRQGRWDAAQVRYRESLDLAQEIADDERFQSYSQQLARLYVSQGRNEEAERLNLETLDRLRSTLAPDHPRVLSAMNYLAVYYEDRPGREDESVALRRDILRLTRDQFGNRHPRVADELDRLGLALNKASRNDESLQVLNQAIAMTLEFFPDGHPVLAVARLHKGITQADLGDHDAAQQQFELAEAAFRDAFQPGHERISQALRESARSFMASGQLGKAEARIEEALAMQTEALGSEHPDVMRLRNQQADLFVRQGRDEDAIEILRPIADAHCKRPATSCEGMASVVTRSLIGILIRTGRQADSEAYVNQSSSGEPGTAGS